MSFSVETKTTTQLKDGDYMLITNTQTSDLLCGRKGDPFQGLKLGSCLTARNELSEETHVLTKQEILLGKVPGLRAVGKRNPGALLCHVPRSFGFYGNGVSFQVVSGQSFWLRVLPRGAHLVQPRWMLARGIQEVDGHAVSPLDLSWTLPVGGGLLVPCSLPGPPVVKQLTQMVTIVPGQGVGGFSQCAFPYRWNQQVHD